ncbi:MAG: hypothetical protein A3B44_01190 [Candidatus Levybacteria bacterium RIFCSPLOWO2_01_FULL_38_21]|nr:MAG: hypothetical protein A3B44_01190 [Candidatus Levybacteria bacterium RIFCSPLOWO2_01_FULL_38_21]
MQRIERSVLTREPTEPIIDWPSVVQGSISGDEESIRQLDGVLRPRLKPLFIGMMKNPDEDKAEDLTQETMIRVLNALPKFRGEGNNFRNILLGWVDVIAANYYSDQYRRGRRHRLTEVPLNDNIQISSANIQEGDAKYDITDATVFNILVNNFPNLLSPFELRTVEQKISGRSNKEISQSEEVKEVSIRVRLSRARTRIEKNILIPAGFKKVFSFKEAPLMQAGHNGTLKTIKILRAYYTREEDVRAYREKCKFNQSLIDAGYVLISENVTASEYNLLLWSDRVLKSNGRSYIKADDLEKFREEHKSRRKKRIIPPSPSHKKLIDLCNLYAQYERARHAIKTGRLPAIKSGNLLFVRKEDFNTWVEILGK